MDLPHPSSRKPSKYQPQVGIYIYTTVSFCYSSLFSSAPLLPVSSPRALKHARTPLHLTSHSLRISAPSIVLIHQATQGLDRCPPQGSAFFDREGDLPGDPVVFLVSPKELRGSRRGLVFLQTARQRLELPSNLGIKRAAVEKASTSWPETDQGAGLKSFTLRRCR